MMKTAAANESRRHIVLCIFLYHAGKYCVSDVRDEIFRHSILDDTECQRAIQPSHGEPVLPLSRRSSYNDGSAAFHGGVLLNYFSVMRVDPRLPDG